MITIVEHVPNEKAGTIRDFLAKERMPFREIRLFAGEKLPHISEMSALIVMGGPMNVYEEDKHPFLKEEDSLIREAVKENVPFLGICLGSQLLAKAMGARVMKAAQPEVGWSEVELTAEAGQSRLFQGFKPEKLKVLQWHEDTFDIPKGGWLLASNPIVTNQAFAVGDNAFGLQFHLEVDRPMLEDWFKKREDKDAIVAEYDAYRPKLSVITERLYRNFFGSL